MEKKLDSQKGTGNVILIQKYSTLPSIRITAINFSLLFLGSN